MFSLIWKAFLCSVFVVRSGSSMVPAPHCLSSLTVASRCPAAEEGGSLNASANFCRRAPLSPYPPPHFPLSLLFVVCCLFAEDKDEARHMR